MSASEPVQPTTSDSETLDPGTLEPRPLLTQDLEPSPLPRQHDDESGAGLGVLVLLMVSTFGFATSLTMLGPLLVDLSRELDVSLGQAGLLAAALAVSWAVAAPFAGLLSDRFGRRPMIVLALSGLGIVTVGAGLAPNYGSLVALGVRAGLFGGFGPGAVLAAAGALFPPHRRGMAMGWANLGFSLAAIAGVPGIGAIGGGVRWRRGVAPARGGVPRGGLLVPPALPPPPPPPA